MTDPRKERWAELPERGRAGIGHDLEFPTQTADRIMSAEAACRRPPSKEMLRLVAEVRQFLGQHNARHVVVVADFRLRGTPGALTVRWNEGVPAAVVAARFAVSFTDDGTPRVPGWLSLRADDDFDLRWQPAY